MIRATRLMMAFGMTTAMVLASGCSDRSKLMWKYPHAEMATSNESSEEHYQRVSTVDRTDRRALADDLDTFFMTDRPTRLSKWHSR